MTILLVIGSVRDERAGTRVAQFVRERLAELGHDVLIADPLQAKLPILSKVYKEFPEGAAPAAMEDIAEMIRRADGVIVLSVEYNHGVPPALSNLLDHFLEEWFHKPAGIVTYSAGRYGGVRVLTPLRAMLGELGMVSVSSSLAIPSVGEALDLSGTDQTTWLTGAADRFLKDLVWWTEAAKRQRALASTPF